ncbi:cytochrome P450 [Spongiactinospora sp. 9N601]|uniref:cytochrome P450 n=1 Tax=Spongiactinospora sp. 9N601 TaxID=3375149 RepID=UPI0037B223AA
MDHISERYAFPQDKWWLHGRRPEAPVVLEADTGVCHVYGYPELQEVFADPATYSSDITRIMPKTGDTISLEGFLTQMDPPEHGKLRKLASHAFTPRVIAGLEPAITTLTGELLDAAAGRSRWELVSELAYPLPVIVIADLLGVPAGDRSLFKKWADAMFETDQKISLAEEDLRPDDGGASLQAWHELTAYLAGHTAERRHDPRADLLTKLVEAEVDGERLPDEQVVNFAMILLLAGHITTTMLLGNTVLLLDAHPQLQARVRADRSLVPAVIEESLRYLTPFAGLTRITNREAVLGGVTIPADQFMMVWPGPANRDPRQFPDPDVFDPFRDSNAHVAFGRGIHFCMGAPLARLEGRVALNLLLDRFPELRVDPDDSPEFLIAPTMTGLRKLPMA